MFLKRLMVCLALLAGAAGATGQTRYVTDDLKLPVRTGESVQHRIVKMLDSGTKVELLEPGREYSRVRTADGVQGWMLTRYLQAQPVAKDRVQELIEERDQFALRNLTLEQQLQELSGSDDPLETDLTRLNAEHRELQARYAELEQAAGSTLDTQRQLDDLRAQLQAREQALDELEADNRRLLENAQREWFLIGAAVLGVGLLIGVLLPGLRSRRSRGGF